MKNVFTNHQTVGLDTVGTKGRRCSDEQNMTFSTSYPLSMFASDKAVNTRHTSYIDIDEKVPQEVAVSTAAVLFDLTGPTGSCRS